MNAKELIEAERELHAARMRLSEATMSENIDMVRRMCPHDWVCTTPVGDVNETFYCRLCDKKMEEKG